MGAQPSRPSLGGLFGIHRIIMRSCLSCAENGAKAGAEGNKWQLADLKDYMYHVFLIIEEHHFHEEEWFFPAWRKYAPEVMAQVDKFCDDHKTLVKVLHELETIVGPKRVDGVRLPEHQNTTAEELKKAGDLFKQLADFFKDHFIAEETIATGPTWEKVPDADAIELHKKILAHVQEGKDSNIRLVINWYMQTEAEREEMFGSDLPWIVRVVLIPRVWYSSYQHMVPFFAHPPV